MNIELQPFQPKHYHSFERLQHESSDGGAVSVRTRYLVPLSELFEHSQKSKGYVAINDDQIVGAAFATYGELSLNGTLRPAALLNSLVVHPDFRGKGIAGQLTRRRIDDALADLGEDTLLLATIQQGNAPSIANARRWAKTFISPFKIATFKPIARKPDMPYKIQAVTDETMDVYERVNDFKGRHFNVYHPYTEDLFKNMLNYPHDITHHLLLVDDNNKPKAGVTVSEFFKVNQTEVVHIPVVLRLLNQFVRMIPPDGIMHILATGDLWYESSEYGRLLLQQIRHLYYGKANIINAFYDPNGPHSTVYRPRFWESRVSGLVAFSEDLPEDTRFSIEFPG